MQTHGIFPAEQAQMGLLPSIPKGTRVIWAEPMILGKVCENTVIYVNPPLYKQKEYIHQISGSTSYLTLTEKAAEKHGKEKDEHSLIPSRHSLEKGTEVLYRKAAVPHPDDKSMSISPFAVEIATFESKHDDNGLPESGRGVEIKQRGFLFKTAIKESKKEYYIKSNEYLFPADQNINNTVIKQTVFGDCYLLSTIMCILSTTGGDAFIKKMMRHNPATGLVYMRLYNPISKQPEYIAITDQIFCEGNKETMQHKQLWVHMLEKAYAGYGLAMQEQEIKFHHSSFHAIYGSGGQAQLAFQIITGQEAKSYTIQETFSEDEDQPFTHELVTLAYFTAVDSAKKDTAKMLYDSHAQVRSLFNNDISSMYRFGETVKFLTESQPEEYASFLELISQLESLDNKATLADINQLTDFLIELKNNLPKNSNEKNNIELFISLVFNYITNSNYYSHDPFDGQYSITLLNHFNLIRDKLITNHLITAGTVEDLPKTIPGLRKNHSYAILDVKTIQVNGKDHHFIKLRNPWGRVGRVYEWGNDNVIAKENKDAAEFWLELNDFSNYFKRYQVCNPIPGLTQDNTLVQQEALKQAKISSSKQSS